ncbi:GspH/FimT family protein [Vibrio sp. WXL210]|uniref:GspH/FimT family protein n=1 Tax=Vibrio sp. WXL210 TaxID=3450709 RepID=UPI003EC544A3
MNHGFSLLELLVSLTLLVTLLAFTLPNMHTSLERKKIVLLADELHNLLVYAKAESIYRNSDLWVHIAIDNADRRSWQVHLTDSDTLESGTTLRILTGSDFEGLELRSNYTANQIKLMGATGKIKSGSLEIFSQGTPQRRLKLKSSYAASRIVVCGVEGAWYGFTAC